MKRLFPVLLLFSVIVYFSSCEKDDICVEGDTPLLVIGFYDFEDTLEFKAVPNLRIKALVQMQGDSLLNDATAYGFSDRGSSGDSITIPLRISENVTPYQIISGSADNDEGNENGSIDTLSFTYTVNERFVSKACGFVANFNELDTVRNVFADDWIKRITVQETDVELSNTIHVKIFH